MYLSMARSSQKQEIKFKDKSGLKWDRFCDAPKPNKCVNAKGGEGAWISESEVSHLY